MTDPVFMVPSVKPVDIGAAYCKSFEVCAAPYISNATEIFDSLRSDLAAFSEEGWTAGNTTIERTGMVCRLGRNHWRVTRA